MSTSRDTRSKWRMLRIAPRLGSLLAEYVDRRPEIAGALLPVSFAQWGGVPRPVTVEDATPDEIRRLRRIARLLSRMP